MRTFAFQVHSQTLDCCFHIVKHLDGVLLSVFEEAKSGAESREQVETFDDCGTDEKQGWVLLDWVEDTFELFESFTDANIIGRGGEEFFEGGRNNKTTTMEIVPGQSIWEFLPMAIGVVVQNVLREGADNGDSRHPARDGRSRVGQEPTSSGLPPVYNRFSQPVA